jgi:hypothetical protein
MLNLALMRHWQNWVTVLLMVIIACYAGNLVAKSFYTKGQNNG